MSNYKQTTDINFHIRYGKMEQKKNLGQGQYFSNLNSKKGERQQKNYILNIEFFPEF